MVGDLLLETVYQLEKNPQPIESQKKMKVGVDLGTSSIVLVVLAEDNTPLICLSEEAEVVKDGLVVDFFAATRIVEKLRLQAEELLGRKLIRAAGAIPPQTGRKSAATVANVIEGAGFEADTIFDEPYAAAAVLELKDGAVVDIGGGTTGISIFEKGQAIYSADEATGGYHMALVLAGYYQIDLIEAEKRKREVKDYEIHFSILRPVKKKMAHLTQQFINDFGNPVNEVYLVGGASMFPQCVEVFEAILELSVVQPVHPRFVTPVGIAMLSKSF